jgi:23S rRNA (guanosine2251-2'-O)-methyltransferase
MTDNRSWRGRASLAVYGRRTVIEALRAAGEGHLSVEELRLARDVPGDYKRDAHELAASLGVECRECRPAAVRELSRDARHDQGVAARVALRRVVDAQDFADSLHGPAAASPTRLVAFDGLTNPQNIGMTLRAAVAAGFAGALWPLEGSPWISGLLIKASASTVFRATIATCPTLAEGLDALASRGFTLAGLTAADASDLWDHDPPHRACYVVGSETAGLSPGTIDRLHERLRIPMHAGVESLNAATAAAVLCFHIERAASRR